MNASSLSNGPIPLLALSQFTTKFQTFADDLELVRRGGFAGLEVCENKLDRDQARAADELKALRDSGLPVCSVQPCVHAVFPDQMASEPRDPGARLDEFLRSMDRFLEALPGQTPTFVLISGCAPEHDLARARETLAAHAAKLAEAAAQRNCRVAFETLNPVMMNVDTFVCRWDEAVNLAEMVASEHFGLVCDLWNIWQEPGIMDSVCGDIERVALVHVSDWRDGGPRRLNDRLIPGQGVIPWAQWGAALRAASYHGWICLEMLSDSQLADSYYHRPIAEVLAEGRRALDEASWFEPSACGWRAARAGV